MTFSLIYFFVFAEKCQHFGCWRLRIYQVVRLWSGNSGNLFFFFHYMYLVLNRSLCINYFKGGPWLWFSGHRSEDRSSNQAYAQLCMLHITRQRMKPNNKEAGVWSLLRKAVAGQNVERPERRETEQREARMARDRTGKGQIS